MESIKGLVEGIPLSTDYLSVRAYNCLRRAGYFYLAEVIDLDKQELLRIKNFGKQSVDEIYSLHDKLKEFSRSEAIRYCCNVGEAEIGNIGSAKNLISHVKRINIEVNGFMCLNDAGIIVEDVPIQATDFSTRAYNALKRAKIDTVRELALQDTDDFMHISGIGKFSYDEIYTFIENRTVVLNNQPALNEGLDEVYEAVSKICAYFEPCFSEEISKLSRNLLIKHLSDMRDSDGHLQPVDESVLKNLIRVDPIKRLLQDKILQIVGNSIFDCISLDDCKRDLARIDVIDNEAIAWLTDDLIQANQIIVRNGFLYGTTITFDEWCSSLDEKYQSIIRGRCIGSTLEEIGLEIGVTRERVRQIASKALMKKPQLLEDSYSVIFTKYAFSNEEYQKLFDVKPIIIGYLNLVYEKGKGDIFDFIKDRTIPDVCRNRCRKVFEKKYIITETDEIIELNREEAMRWFLQKFYSDKETTMKELEEAYVDWLKSYALEENEKMIYANEHSFEANVARTDFCVLKQGKRVRYYDVKGVDIEKLLADVNISQYDGYEISTYKIFLDNAELMQQLDIRDEYELHNIFRKHPGAMKNHNITIGKMPIVNIGNGDRYKQVRDLLYQLAPIGYFDLALEYEIRYGVRKETVCANYFVNIMDYYDGSIFNVDQPRLSLDEHKKIKEILTEDFYLMNDLSNWFTKIVGKNHEELLNPLNIKELGFRPYSQYVIRNVYPTADSFFTALLTREPVIDLNKFNTGVRSVQAFSASLRDLRDSLELIEIAKEVFVTYDYFCSSIVNCDKETLKVIGRRLVESKEDELFSINVEEITVDDNPYIKNINNVYFYNSLVRIQKGIKSTVIGDVCIGLRGNREPVTRDVFIKLLEDNGPLSFDELVELAFAEYGLSINKYKVSYLLENVDGVKLDLVLETARLENSSEENAFWKNSIYEKTIIAKYNVLLTSTDRIEKVYRQDCYSAFLNYCHNNDLIYMKDLLDLDLERVLTSIGLSKPIITEVIDLFFHWVDGINNQTNEAREILDLFFK